jgi:hypothetical protein
MSKRFDNVSRIIGLFLLVMSTVPFAKADNLVVNGSFENNDVTWHGNNDGVIRIQAPYFSGTNQTAPDGSFFVVLQSGAPAGSSGGPNATITQVVNGLIVGSQYTLTFDLLPWANPDPHGNVCPCVQSSTMNVVLTFSDGTQIVQAFSTPSVVVGTSSDSAVPFIYSVFYTENLTFTAASSSLSLSFEDPMINENSRGNNPGLDDVRLDVSEAAATPEPGSIFLLATGLVGAFSKIRRK